MVDYCDRPWLQNYDPGIPRTLDYPDLPLHAFLERSARAYPHAPACRSMPEAGTPGAINIDLSYSQLNTTADALAAALVALGLRKGERVAIILPNCTQFVIAFYATLKAGGVIAATNPTFPPNRLQNQIADSGAAFAVVHTPVYDAVKSIQAQTGLRRIVVTDLVRDQSLLAVNPGERNKRAIAIHPEDHWLTDLVRRFTGHCSDVNVQATDHAVFQYTGGTTGVSKAAVASHAALVANTLHFRTWLAAGIAGQPHEEVFLAAIPLFHVFGMVAVMSFAVSMASLMVMVPNSRDIDALLTAINACRPTFFMGVPGLYNAINNHGRVRDGEISMESLRVCISGSAPLPLATKRNFEALSGGKLLEGFGMSETPTATHINPYAGENRAGSIGLPLPDVECRIVSLEDEATDVPVGEAGELLLRGPQLMLGYHGMPAETANALRQHADGKMWLHTGDVATMDADGYFYIVDRKKDMALIGGFNVYPRIVEDVLMSHPAVLEVGVAGVPHPDPSRDGQEMLKAWVVVKPGEHVSEEELIAFAATELARYEIPTQFAFVTGLPKTTVGKVLRRELVRMEMETRKVQ